MHISSQRGEEEDEAGADKTKKERSKRATLPNSRLLRALASSPVIKIPSLVAAISTSPLPSSSSACSARTGTHPIPMGKDTSSTSFHRLCYFLFALSTLSSLSFLYWSQRPAPCKPDLFGGASTSVKGLNQSLSLLSFASAWNRLHFSTSPPRRRLKIALFVKKWPQQGLAGGLERHAMTLHLALARRGHELHVFTASPNSSAAPGEHPGAFNLKFHLTRPTAAGYLNQPLVWEQFHAENSSGRPFDVVHTESVALFHGRARNITNLAVSWHGIAYETIHSDIVQDILRSPEEPRKPAIAERIAKVIEEVNFFGRYAHHVATSDHVGDVLKRVYWIPEERVHIIVNGVDEEIYRLDRKRGSDFRKKFKIPEDASLVIGMAGRLVKDKGHPVMFEALKQLFEQDETLQRRVFVLVAGDGPWSLRYKELFPNVIVAGPLEQTQLASFYSALDVFVNPTLRAQGLDHTFLEAMLSGVPVMGTRFASITGSVITDADMGYAFVPTVASIKEAVYRVCGEGREVLRKKGEAARSRALRLFTATKMATAYERLFLCISQQTQGWKDKDDFCSYPLPWDGSTA
ncbi:hypothetical protein Taro_047071 [Colocasia esculenta]|uniref:Glycosyltransferase subfamily 4-like N-terminal domain-containing protein n=1 Tax=Colocasia esculenta TaxID=4460 RepID=A0A843X3B5_COLES|nr:hypothetical protein [Colocasia esculenta]